MKQTSLMEVAPLGEDDLVDEGRRYKLFDKISIYGGKKEKDVALKWLITISNLRGMTESDARLRIQRVIDQHNLRADILYDGNGVYSKKRIIRNLRRILKEGVLYNKEKPTYIPIGSMLRMPAGGEPLLSKYFYEFLHLCCGSIAHYNITGWIAEYPTAEDLRQFFRRNEFGKRVLEYQPRWATDRIEIVKAIEKILKV